MKSDQIPRVSVTPSLRFLYTSKVEVDSPLLVCHSTYGERRIVAIKGGAFHGPRLSGRVLPGGADWQIIRYDGVTELEARYTLKTHDDTLIYVYNKGLRRGSKEVMERIASGDKVDPSEYYFRATPIFETGAPEYTWLNALVAVATGERRLREVIITVYEVT
jgi:hypothetical protein